MDAKVEAGKESRKISETFLRDLKEGLLFPVLERVRRDETLMLALRGSYINIYYRGGNLIEIAEQASGYAARFDANYVDASDAALKDEVRRLQALRLQDADSVRAWMDAIPRLKLAIDLFLGGKAKHEREFQQLVARENNASAISNDTEYFIADIEYARKELGARFDLLAVQWLAGDRRDGSNCRLALVEMKYGDNALGGTSGLQKHLDDIQKLLSDAQGYEALLGEVEDVFEQLRTLGLIRFGEKLGDAPRNQNAIRIDRKEKPEIVFLLANHNPRSRKLREILEHVREPEQFDLRFFVASFAGYGMHSPCMLTLDQFRKLL